MPGHTGLSDLFPLLSHVHVLYISPYRFKPPDACYIELMRFRVRPPKNRELPIQLKAVMCVTGNKVRQGAQNIVLLLGNALPGYIFHVHRINHGTIKPPPIPYMSSWHCA